MKKIKGFTLAEVLITLAIIGVVAALTIPSVIVNTNQMEFKTGLRKAVSVLNQAITMNKALTGESPYDNNDIYGYLQQYMSVTKRVFVYVSKDGSTLNSMPNTAFYTTDGMRFEVAYDYSGYGFPLHESGVKLTDSISNQLESGKYWNMLYGKCGSYGLAHNPDSTTNPPCFITVDVNGDRKPSPQSILRGDGEIQDNTEWGAMADTFFDQYKYADPNGRLLTDIFSILITDQGAIPYGVVAQKAMYQAQK